MRYPRGMWTPGPWMRSGGTILADNEHCHKYVGVAGASCLTREDFVNGDLMAAAPELAEVVRRGLEANVFVGHLKEAAEDAYSKALGGIPEDRP